MSILHKFSPSDISPKGILYRCALALACFWMSWCVSLSAFAQTVPDKSIQTRLVWATLVAVDNANRTNDYSVIRALGSQGFQAQNTETDLAQTFAGLRDNRIDVGRAILSNPTFYIPPYITQAGKLRLRGGFETRPRSLRFDMLYSPNGAGWRLDAISVIEMDSDAPRN